MLPRGWGSGAVIALAPHGEAPHEEAPPPAENESGLAASVSISGGTDQESTPGWEAGGVSGPGD
jgi:hypothetical protein